MRLAARIYRTFSALLAVALLGGCVAACGGAGRHGRQLRPAASASVSKSNLEEAKLDADKDGDSAHPDEDELSKPPSVDRDNDTDSSGHAAYDSDDQSIADFGHSANASQSAQIGALVRRYYAVATAENGNAACSMLYSTYAEAIPEDYGTSPPGPSYASGSTCPVVMSEIFTHFHDRLTARLAKLHISRVRVREHQGVVILSFGSMPVSEIRVSREGRIWRILALIDTDLP